MCTQNQDSVHQITTHLSTLIQRICYHWTTAVRYDLEINETHVPYHNYRKLIHSHNYCK